MTKEMEQAAQLTAGIIFFFLCVYIPLLSFVICALVFLLFWMYQRIKLKRGFGSEIPCWVGRGFFGFYFFLLLSVLFHGDSIGGAAWFLYLLYLLPFYMAFSIICSYDSRKGMLWGMAAGAAAACFWGLHQLPEALDAVRIDSFYLHPNQFGFMIEMMIPVMVYGLFYLQKTWQRGAVAAVLLLLVGCLVLTESRGAVMGLSLGSAGSLLFWMFCRRKSMEKSVKRRFWAVAVLILTAGFLLIHSFGGQRIEQGEVHPGGERIMMIQASFNMWKDHPISGVGLVNWKENYYGAYRPAENREKGLKMPHNVFIYFLSTAGILGGLGYVFYLFCMTVGLYRVGSASEQAAPAVTLWTVFASFTLHGLVDMANPSGYFLYYGVLGGFLAVCIQSGKCTDEGKDGSPG